MEMLRDEDLAILAKGKEKAYLRDSRLMAQELIMRRAGQVPQMEVAKQSVPYDYDGLVITVPRADLLNARWTNAFTGYLTGTTFFYQSSGTGNRYICYRVS